MRVCGVIAEYDPFHRGHRYHLETARALTGADYVVCVMGRAFSQRGAPMLFGTQDRARMALLGGADLVLGMPVSFSCAAADRFAMGGVRILDALGVVTHLGFGTEDNDLAHLKRIADMLERPSPHVQDALKEALRQGKSFARAQGEALDTALPGVQAVFRHRANMILAVSYLRAMQRLGSAMTPVPVKRKGAYHDTGMMGFASASAVRAALLRGDWQGVEHAVPATSYRVITRAMAHSAVHVPQALDTLILSRILETGIDTSGHVPEMSEGLDMRIQRAARYAVSREGLLALVKTRRYPRARINRGLTHWMLGTDADSLPAQPDYAYLLGARERAKPLLAALRQQGFPLITRPAKEDDEHVQADMRAEQLWALGAGQPAAQAYQHRFLMLSDTGEWI